MPPHSILVKAALLIPGKGRYFPTLTCTRQIFNCLAPRMAGPTDSELHDYVSLCARQHAVFRRADTFRFATRLVFDGGTAHYVDAITIDEVIEIISSVDYLRSLTLRFIMCLEDSFGEFLAQLPHLEQFRECQAYGSHFEFFRPLLKSRSLSLRCDAARAISYSLTDRSDHVTALRDYFIPAIDAAQTNGELVEMLQMSSCLNKNINIEPDDSSNDELFASALQRIESCAIQSESYPPLRVAAVAAFSRLAAALLRKETSESLRKLVLESTMWQHCNSFLFLFMTHHGDRVRHYCDVIKTKYEALERVIVLASADIGTDLARDFEIVFQLMFAVGRVLVGHRESWIPSSLAIPFVKIMAQGVARCLVKHELETLRVIFGSTETNPYIRLRCEHLLCGTFLDQCRIVCLGSGFVRGFTPQLSRQYVQTLLECGFVEELCGDLSYSSISLLNAYDKRSGRSLDTKVADVVRDVWTLRDVLQFHNLRLVVCDDDKAWIRDTLLPTLFADRYADRDVPKTYELGRVLSDVAPFASDAVSSFAKRAIALESFVLDGDSQQQQQQDQQEQPAQATNETERRRQREGDGKPKRRRFVHKAIGRWVRDW